ncbi:hypothetical protein ACLB2K_046854 [Fragaria x ananassa]
MDQADYLGKEISRKKMELEEVKRENKVLEEKLFLGEYLNGKSLDGLNPKRVSDLAVMIVKTIEAVQRRKEVLINSLEGSLDAGK